MGRADTPASFPTGFAGAATWWAGLSWAGLSCVAGVLASIVLLLHHGELTDADSGIEHDFGWSLADHHLAGEVRATLALAPDIPG